MSTTDGHEPPPRAETRVDELPAEGPTPSLADKLNKLFAAAQSSAGRPLSNRAVAAGVTADGVNISESFIYYLRTGQRDNPTKKHLEGIARFFNVPASYFFDDDIARRIHAELELVTAMRDADVRSIALRSSKMTPRMRQWLAQTIAGLDEAREE